jgi:hypothetical protein
VIQTSCTVTVVDRLTGPKNDRSSSVQIEYVATTGPHTRRGTDEATGQSQERTRAKTNVNVSGVTPSLQDALDTTRVRTVGEQP